MIYSKTSHCIYLTSNWLSHTHKNTETRFIIQGKRCAHAKKMLLLLLFCTSSLGLRNPMPDDPAASKIRFPFHQL